MFNFSDHLSKKEAVIQEEYDQIRARRDARLAKEKEAALKCNVFVPFRYFLFLFLSVAGLYIQGFIY